MAAMGIRELGRNLSKVVEQVETSRRPMFITRHGQPVAAMVPLDEEALEDWLLANAPEFVDDMAAAERALEEGTADDLDDVLADLEGDDPDQQ